MIRGKIGAISIKDFVTKAGVSMLKIGIKIDGNWYSTVSKFQPKYTKGTEVFFETQADYPDSITMGSLKVVPGGPTAVTADTILANSWKDVETPTALEVKRLKREVEDLKRKLKEQEDDQLLKELGGDFDDELPF